MLHSDRRADYREQLEDIGRHYGCKLLSTDAWYGGSETYPVRISTGTMTAARARQS